MERQDQIAINNMRLEGHSPSEIAAKLGLSPNTVRSHIHRHRHVRDERSCKHCGNPLVQTKGRREKKFCSDSCRMAWWNSHKEEVNKRAFYTLTCQHCGKVFDSYGNSNRKSRPGRSKKRPHNGRIGASHFKTLVLQEVLGKNKTDETTKLYHSFVRLWYGCS